MTTLRASAITTLLTHRFSQAPNLMRHFIRFGASKAENKALADIGAGISGGKGPQPKTFLRGPGRNLLVGHPRRKRDYQMHTSFHAKNLHLGALYLGAKFFSEGL